MIPDMSAKRAVEIAETLGSVDHAEEDILAAHDALFHHIHICEDRDEYVPQAWRWAFEDLEQRRQPRARTFAHYGGKT